MPTGMVSLHKLFTGALGEMNGKNFDFTRGWQGQFLLSPPSLPSQPSHHCPLTICNSRPVFGLDIRARKAEEVFQEFIECLSHSQMLDRMSRD